MQVENKIKTLLGFALKSNTIIFGLDNLKSTKKRMSLVLACSSLSEKNLEKIIKLTHKKNITTIILNNIKLESLLNKDNVKTVGLTNESMVNEILKHAELGSSYKIIKRGASVE